MKLLILGGAGMLGHKLWQTAKCRAETWATVRSVRSLPSDAPFEGRRVIAEVHAEHFETVARAFESTRPDVVVNCLGVVKQRGEAKDPITSLTVNSLFPHQLASLCSSAGARLIHISTDCVFSGRSGQYRESDEPDAIDLYGRSKQLGEVSGPDLLTLRTSMIGRELTTSQGLVEWLLAQRDRAPGFTNAVFSGLTTIELSRVILDIAESRQNLQGVYHVASNPIAKYDLLVLLNRAFRLGLTIERDEFVRIDRSLDARRFQAATGYRAPDWTAMIGEMADDETPYEKWRQQHAR